MIPQTALKGRSISKVDDASCVEIRKLVRLALEVELGRLGARFRDRDIERSHIHDTCIKTFL